MNLLFLFAVLDLSKFFFESALGWVNKRYFENKKNQEGVCLALGLSDEDFAKTLAYTRDKYYLGFYSNLVSKAIFWLVLLLGGFGKLELWAKHLSVNMNGGPVLSGLVFFAGLAFASSLLSLPWDYAQVFLVEEKHGFNRQKRRGFFMDRLKGALLGSVIGGLCLGGLLWVIESTGKPWWIWAWITVGVFQMLTLWIYPSLLAPIFNKFTAIPDGDLKREIHELARRVNFRAGGLFTMDASSRSSHGNAYFTGVFGEKRIVLFDTLLAALTTKEIVAVLAHELGHFKLNHVRWMMIRGVLMLGLMFYLFGLAMPVSAFYEAFSLAGVSAYGALFVFSLWFGVLSFCLSPLNSWLSRKNEFAADRFAKVETKNPEDLGSALLKLRQTNHSMPLSHPLYSLFYHSHPSVLERLTALGVVK